MFTGIVETTGTVHSLTKEKENLIIGLKSDIAGELKIDQSLSHNGVCLTVTDLQDDVSYVTAVQETLIKTNLSELTEGSLVNLERSMSSNSRFDGHIVQGHVDQVGRCTQVIENEGSWLYDFEYDFEEGHNILVEKGSVCINGVSLTVFDVGNGKFRITIIPYTFENTNFKTMKAGDQVNLEFDVIGKYVQKMLSQGYLDYLKG